MSELKGNPAEAEHTAGFQVGELAAMHPGTIVDKKALAEILRCDPRTISNMVSRRELPPPVKMRGRTIWTAGAILKYVEARLERELEESELRAKRLAS